MDGGLASSWAGTGTHRNEELRGLSDAAATLKATSLGVDIPTESRADSGLRQFQVWMKKWQNAEKE
jgi:hypothetical protein